MTGLQTEVVGAAEFSRTLDRAAEDLEHPVAAQEAAGRLVAQRGSSYAPKLSGALARSLTASVQGDTVAVGGPLPYTAVTEYGGGNNIPAQPFLRPALAASEAIVLGLYEADAQQALNKVRGA